VAQIRTIQKAQAVGRVLWKLSNRHYAVRGSVAGAKAVAKATARTTRILLLEVTGFFFAVFALMGFAAAWREWSKMQAGQTAIPTSHIVVALAFTAVFIYFSANSFWRARREGKAKEGSNG
jgi:TRAP-type C4-dicarboxylate transport system permease small subunit